MGWMHNAETAVCASRIAAAAAAAVRNWLTHFVEHFVKICSFIETLLSSL